ncbi:uncharacterized protein [Physcomitrium patens]|uniref:uncharacterized protein isoform X3 n=1 Tax=Physcomitrium patens TaxID=3218 RepID=UPI000D152119|nr:telomere length regulation protein TEL2 homolog isoform X3 [Physcomitrium patens]|eukprot:XP_024364658.1 telomere length regulation protein TEL2 homolog isoform X3 [Physcomitrella patens]
MATLEDDATVDDASTFKPLDSLLGDLLTAVATTISNAVDVSIVLQSLHPFASLFFMVPADFISFAGQDKSAESELIAIEKLARGCRNKAKEEYPEKDISQTLRHALYESSVFPTLTTLLLHQVAADWLACFPSLGVKWLFDEFFRQGPPKETLLNLVPFLVPDHGREEKSHGGLDSRIVVSAQAKRLLQICLVHQDGIQEISLSFGHRSDLKLREDGLGNIGRASWLKDQYQVAQLIASIPDRAGLDTPSALQSPTYFKSVSRQLISAGERCWEQILQNEDLCNNGTIVFIGEVISRLSRRGQADVIAAAYVPVIMQHMEEVMAKLEVKSDLEMNETALHALKSLCKRNLWTAISASIKDLHSMEKWVEALLREMAIRIETDIYAYCLLWMSFGSLLSTHDLTRMVFLDKCLFVKILPIRCLRWVLQFSVLHTPITIASGKKVLQLDTGVVTRLAQVWATNDFIRSASLPKQAYLTAAVGICVRRMDKEDMDKCGELMRFILQGVTNRLDSPLPLIRDMSKRLALTFSLAINPAKPLLLDDEDEVKDLDDWDDLSVRAVDSSKEKRQSSITRSTGDVPGSSKEDVDSIKPVTGFAVPSVSGFNHDADRHERQMLRRQRREKMALEEDDPDAVVNLGQVDAAWLEEAEGEATDSSSDLDSDTDGSLQPYDMSDGESELERRKLPLQLRECAANLRKSDDPDAVEKSLQIAEQLIRAMPVELDNTAEELTQALVHVRPGATAVEGEEDTLEKQRHGALVALLVCAPLSCIVMVTQEVFSPHLDISQRLLLLDVISDAAQELAGKSTVNHSRSQLQQRGLITEPTGSSLQSPWYRPSHLRDPPGAGPWSEVPAFMPGNSLVGWAQRYERELPLRKGDRRPGKSRKWAPRSMQLREDSLRQKGFSSHEPVGKNQFAPLAAAFMLPIMRDYDKKDHGVDFLESGFIVLGKILFTLGVCMECITSQPEAVVLGINLLDLLRSRAVANHREAYVRRAALYAASRVIVALHPSQVVDAIVGTDSSIASGLGWVREWALGIANNETDSDCATLHSEMALQAMRAVQSTPVYTQSPSITVQSSGDRSIIMPF